MAYNPSHEYEHLYDPAIKRYKIENARKGRLQRWKAKDDRAQEIIDFLNKKVGIWTDANDEAENFLESMSKAIFVWGHLTDGQRNAMVKILDKEKARKAEWASRDGKCEFVGTVGERQAFEVTVKHVVELEGIYGISYLHICRDADDNVIIYKGTQHWEKGAQVTFMAKVKDHGVRDGVKQTIVQRPTKVKVNGEDY